MSATKPLSRLVTAEFQVRVAEYREFLRRLGSEQMEAAAVAEEEEVVVVGEHVVGAHRLGRSDNEGFWALVVPVILALEFLSVLRSSVSHMMCVGDGGRKCMCSAEDINRTRCKETVNIPCARGSPTFRPVKYEARWSSWTIRLPCFLRSLESWLRMRSISSSGGSLA